MMEVAHHHHHHHRLLLLLRRHRHHRRSFPSNVYSLAHVSVRLFVLFTSISTLRTKKDDDGAGSRRVG